jgi:uroporphyrinogen decarboxylase
MLPRERVVAALRHEEPDMVPLGENHVHSRFVERVLGREILYSNGFKELNALWDGRRDDIVRDAIAVHCELPKALGWDYVRVNAAPKRKPYARPRMTGETSWLDEGGREIHFNPDIGTEVAPRFDVEMTVDDLPEPGEDFRVDPSEMDAIRGVAEAMKPTHFVIARLPLDGTFPYKQTVGIEEYLVRMVTDPEFVQRAARVYVDRAIKYIEAFLEAGADAVMPTDDYADNRGLMMGPERFKEFILPGIERQVEAAHAKGGFFIKHTDGRVWDALDGIVGAGVDGWHGIQPSVGMDLKLLKEKYGERVCFFGGVNCETLIEGSAAEVEREARYAIAHAAPGGGLVLTSGNGLENGTKFENYMAMARVRAESGRYPIGR